MPMGFLRLLSLPVRAPLLAVLFLVAVVLGNHWTVLQPSFSQHRGVGPELFWTLELLQVLVVVLICTMPELLMRQVSLMMASSRVITLVVTLLFVITAGIYLLRLSLLSDVLILASAVLLARLDLTRAGALPPPLPSMYLLAFVVFAGIGVGHLLPNPTAGWFAEVLISA